MAYTVSQLRKQRGSNSYMEEIGVWMSSFESPNKFESNEPFQDFCLKGNFEAGKVYYLRFMIHRIPTGWYSKDFPQERGLFADADDMTITLLLKYGDEDEEQNPPQIIDTITIDSLAVSEMDIAANTRYFSYTTVFIPARQADTLGFRLSRTAYDALVPDAYNKEEPKYRRWLLEPDTQQANTKGEFHVTGPRIVYSGEGGDVCQLKNIVPKGMHWLKMGFQSRPGSLIVVNKCPIRVGRSGIYEINNGMLIDSFMITAPQGSNNDNIDAFLLDYAYDKTQDQS